MAEIDDLRREVQETKDGFAAVAVKLDEIKAALEAAIAANAEVDGLKAAMVEAAGELDALQITMAGVVAPTDGGGEVVVE